MPIFQGGHGCNYTKMNIGYQVFNSAYGSWIDSFIFMAKASQEYQVSCFLINATLYGLLQAYSTFQYIKTVTNTP